MFALIKKYQKGVLEQQEKSSRNAYHSVSNERRVSFFEENMPIHDCETLSTPKLNKRTLGKQILARWLRLAFPTYILLLFTLSMYVDLEADPPSLTSLTTISFPL